MTPREPACVLNHGVLRRRLTERGQDATPCPECHGLLQPAKLRYCGPCDRWVGRTAYECPACGADTETSL